MSESMSRTPILIVSYGYPRPGTGRSSAVGGERMRQFARHLPRYGFEPTILTHCGRFDEPMSPGLLAAVDLARFALEVWPRSKPGAQGPREGWRVSELRTRGRRWVLPDRATYTWAPLALAKARKLCDPPPRVILSTSPLMAAHFVGAVLASHWRVPWVADVRDGYSFEPPEGDIPTATARRRIERVLYRHASRVITVSDALRDDLRAVGSPGSELRVSTITNGFDSDLFGASESSPTVGATAFTLVYAGTTSFRTGCNLRALCAGLAHFSLASAVPAHLQLMGLFTSDELAWARRGFGLEVMGWQERHVVAQHMKAADVLVVLTGNHSSVATTKLFEYIGAGRPILVIGRASAAARLVEAHGFGISADDEPDGIAAALTRLYTERTAWNARLASEHMKQERERFSRQHQARELAVLLDEVLREAR